MTSPTPPVRVGLIGITGYARTHLRLARLFEEKGRTRLVAATVINPEDEAETVAELKAAGTRIYASYETMLAAEAGSLDLCLIPTGIPWHTRMTLDALAAGLDVLVEKPLAGSVADVEQIRAAEAATGHFVAVGFQDTYNPETMVLKKIICGGRLGKIESVRMLGLWPRPTRYFHRNGWSGRLQAQGAAVNDSPLNNALAHYVHLALFFAGEQVEESAEAEIIEAELYRANTIESFDTAVVQARSKSGLKIFIAATHACPNKFGPVIEIKGTQGVAQWIQEERKLVITIDGKEEIREMMPSRDTREAMFAQILARRHDPKVFISSTTLALRHTQFIEAIHRATEIRTVDPSLIQQIEREGCVYPTIDGIEAALTQAFERQCSLADVGFPPTARSANPA